MNIVSALFRAVGRQPDVRRGGVWHAFGRAGGDGLAHRRSDSRFLYPPSCRHVHFSAPPSRDHPPVEPLREICGDRAGADLLKF